MFSLAITVQLEYINHLLQFFKTFSYYADIMLNAFSDLICSLLCWHNRLVPYGVASIVLVTSDGMKTVWGCIDVRVKS